MFLSHQIFTNVQFRFEERNNCVHVNPVKQLPEENFQCTETFLFYSISNISDIVESIMFYYCILMDTDLLFQYMSLQIHHLFRKKIFLSVL